ncbi:dipeptidyl peptidase 2-like [Centruroides sculpturatus]|uniref:dipeptidyl peptidase 2-like n=1 Tax=Centruroides sculpturatus TaxID=218467 RepID=UPI000C6D552B|nr:dipeptidyl peptidase 2-like [Centruroides sculpturatus]
MLFLLLFSSFLICFKNVSGINYQVKYFNQYIDHFNFFSYGNETFKQRYLVNDSWWLPHKGPIFFYTGNEGNIEAFWENSGFIFDIAPKFKALVIFAEHRYYGESLPFGKNSFNQPNISLLSIEQALIDYVTLIHAIKKDYKAESCPVIAFGGSYGGMLSAYIRFKYPNVVDGALAASAPIILTAGYLGTEVFFESITKTFDNTMPKCKDTVINAYSQIEKWFAEGSKGYKYISSTFSLCKEIKDSTDYNHFLKWTRNAFASAAMMNYPYKTSFMSPFPAFPVKVMCTRLVSSGIPAAGLAAAIALAYNASGTEKCFDIWKEFIDCADPTGCGLGTDSISWDYQSCTEINLYMKSEKREYMFPYLPFNSTMRDEYCFKKYKIIPRENWLKEHIWGKEINQTSNIIFSNGNLDPWAPGGIQYNVSDRIISILIKGGAHHLDLRGKNPADPQSVILARQFEAETISKWITKANEKYQRQLIKS